MSTHSPKTIYLETFGCQMNELDSELVVSQLRSLGYATTADRTSADVVLFNTCSVRAAAEDKVYARVGDMKVVKKNRPEVVIGVIGCMAERDGAGLMKKYPQVDLMCGPSELDKIPLLIDNVVKTRDHQSALTGGNARRSSTLDAAADSLELLDLARAFSPDKHLGSAYVRITRGCNKFCTYCVVPYTRGPEVHRPPDHIVDECKKLADAGVIEITLLGQTVNHYRFDHGAAVSVGGIQQPQIGPGLAAFKNADHPANVGRRVTSFADLLKRIHDEVPAIQRLRFVTNFPRDFGDDILQVIADSPRICRYLHVPAQSGSDRLLKLMNRDYTAGEYVEFVDRVRSCLPGVMLASDFIVGFPTETDEDFDKTAAMIRRCEFKNSFIFKYSPRPGTVAIDRFADDVSEETKKLRNNRLLSVQAEVSRLVHAQQVGKVFDVMIEGVSELTRRAQGKIELGWETKTPRIQMSGRTPGDLIVMFDLAPGSDGQSPANPDDLIGRILPVRIHTAKPLALFGDLAESPAAV